MKGLIDKDWNNSCSCRKINRKWRWI